MQPGNPPFRNLDGAPAWADRLEVIHRRRVVQEAQRDLSSRDLDELTWAELEKRYFDASCQ